MRRALLHALLPTAIYLGGVESLYLWYEASLASDKPGIGVLIGGALSGIMSLPGAELVRALGVSLADSTDRPLRFLGMQIQIAATAGIVYGFTLALLLLVGAGQRQSGDA